MPIQTCIVGMLYQLLVRSDDAECLTLINVCNLQVPIPCTPGMDPLTMLTDDAQIASWNNEGLPSDRMSTENATILCNCERWPLMIDPQLQVCAESLYKSFNNPINLSII